MLLRLRARLALFITLLAVGSTTLACGNSPATEAARSTTATASMVTITDHWDRRVEVPRDPDRVVVLEWEGLVTKSMQLLGLGDRIVGVDSATKKETFRKQVIPAINDATDVGSAWSGLNYESVAALDPDVVFLEAWVASEENRAMHQEVVDRLTDLGLPVIVMLSPSNFDVPSLDTAWEFVGFVGQVFDRTKDTDEIVTRIEAKIAEVTERIPDLPENDRPEAAIFASASYLMGEQSIQSHLLTEVLKAKNVVGPGTFVETSEEKLLALDPETLIVIGHEGYISQDDIYSGNDLGINWGKVSALQAIKGKRLTTLGYDEWRATVETPIALLKMAKVLYPAEFADVDVAAEELAYYQDVFGLTEEAAAAAVEGQHFVGDLAS